jgi:hypothetical protein
MTHSQTFQFTLTSISQRINQSGDAKGAIAAVECAVGRGLGSSGMGSAIGSNTGWVGAESLQAGSLQLGVVRGGFMHTSFMRNGFMRSGFMHFAAGSAKFSGGVVLFDRHDLPVRDLSVQDLSLQDHPIRHKLGGLLPAQRSGSYRCNTTVTTQD